MTRSIDDLNKGYVRNRLIRDIDRMSEQELEAMSAKDLGEVRCLLLETLERDLKKFLVKIDEI